MRRPSVQTPATCENIGPEISAAAIIVKQKVDPAPGSDSSQIVPPQSFNDLLTDRQTEAGAGDIPLCQAKERHEYTSLVLRRDA